MTDTPDTPETVRVRAINNPKVDGRYRAPGSEWECPAHLVGELLEVGAIELQAVETGPSQEEIAEEKRQAAAKLEKEKQQATAKQEAEEQERQKAAELQRPADILAAIAKLDPDNDSLWTKDKENGPTTKALESVLGFSVTAAERDAAWTQFNEAMEATRLAAIVEAIGRMDQADESVWDNETGPTIEALEALLGVSVTESERDAALALFLAANE